MTVAALRREGMDEWGIMLYETDCCKGERDSEGVMVRAPSYWPDVLWSGHEALNNESCQ